MRVFSILFRKEFKNYFLTPFGWVVLALVLLMQGFSMSGAMELMKDGPMIDNFLLVSLKTPHFWFYFLFIFPLLTMRLFAEESKTGTLETLLTAPVTTAQVVFSKYLAAFAFYAILWLPILLQLKIFAWVTGSPAPVEMGHILGTYAILLLMGSFFLAIGCLASTLTSSQIVAGIITIAALVILFFLGFVPYYIGEGFKAAPIFQYVSVQDHLVNFAKGLVDTRPIVYYLSMAVFFLFLTHITLDFRRWKS
ncbi:ABC transporter permease subunit [Verrucomicrobiaceae bacterium R5-34]|uniref:ABC transporter permease subunit n=1 Tax=Oceaniferula flava TaxID=2800421 RepID=A0AAE2VBH3_9BACT|nr:ABC transporter permease [Oceaniferula flavus]MBK1830443.1 ABC transporter permease subunit [Verrucomicrobiaceae bacterium R5-34]MBK1854535.1 ABC transporter permease subunit [Oceaniferula flavus]MBM1135841.1 ABC transporter permease subunit [Oceaniferula flavus]